MKAVSEIFPDPSRLPFPKDVADEVLTVLLDALMEAILYVSQMDGKPETKMIIRGAFRTRRRGLDGKMPQLSKNIPKKVTNVKKIP